MKKYLCGSFVLCLATAAMAQNDTVTRETTKVTRTTTTVASASADLLGLETFNFLDASVVPQGTIDLRIAGRWIDGKGVTKKSFGSYDYYEENDDGIVLTPEIVWGATDRLEIALSVPFWVDGEPEEGNYDTYIGAQWRISDLDENCPAFALAGSIRVPTGDGSNGLDAQLRFIMTNEYESGIRSHLNLWGTSVNTDNYADARDFQYGAVVGLDGPLNDSGSLRWVFDYMYESSRAEGSEDDMINYNYPTPDFGGEKRNSAEIGLQWNINECHKLGFAFQAGLDHAENETPDYAASLTYAYTISR